MLIIISNRNRTRSINPVPGIYNLDTLGQGLDENNNNIVGEVIKSDEGDKLHLYPDSHSVGFMQSIKDRIDSGDNELNRPWVLFVHGNNQSIEKNIKKVKKLESSRKVNVIAFSWPSQPLGEALQKTEIVKNILFKAVTNSLSSVIDPTNIFSQGSKILKNYYDNYKLARKHASASVDNFIKAVEFLNDNLLNTIPFTNKHALFHSLGHKILRDTIEGGAIPFDTANKFSSIVLHQADEDSEEHENWVSQLAQYTESLYITQNVHDGILWAAGIANQQERLGHSTYRHVASKATYITFTYGYNIHEKHNMFNMTITGKNDNEHVAMLFDRILHGYEDKLPRQGDRMPTSMGFAKLRDNPYVFSLVELYDIFEDEETVDVRENPDLQDDM